jgi:uncharacterized protein (DUF362 family)
MSHDCDVGRGSGLTRREVLKGIAAGALLGAGLAGLETAVRPRLRSEVFIGKAAGYNSEIGALMSRGLRELGVSPIEVKGKRILLKPNLVETSMGAVHINTHPHVVRGAIEAFLRAGAQQVMVAEGPGHRRDTLAVLEESGLGPVLHEDRIRFVDLNYMTGYTVANEGRQSKLRTLTFPGIFQDVDWIVSVAKMKTHHWAGVTLSMKNLFGVMPGIYYGWPKNLLHHAGLGQAILDINATVKPHFAIVDGIIGMEGDGPIMGTPRHTGVVVMGRNLAAVDATCARLMGLDPHRVHYLSQAADWLGPIAEPRIHQRGERVASVRTNFALIENIPAHQGLRLSA